MLTLSQVQAHDGYKFLLSLIDPKDIHFQAKASGVSYAKILLGDRTLDDAWKVVNSGIHAGYIQAIVDLATQVGIMPKVHKFADNMPPEWLDRATREDYKLQRRSGLFALIISEVSAMVTSGGSDESNVKEVTE